MWRDIDGGLEVYVCIWPPQTCVLIRDLGAVYYTGPVNNHKVYYTGPVDNGSLLLETLLCISRMDLQSSLYYLM